jgi:hypothetical protein
MPRWNSIQGGYNSLNDPPRKKSGGNKTFQGRGLLLTQTITFILGSAHPKLHYLAVLIPYELLRWSRQPYKIRTTLRCLEAITP